MWIIVTLLAVVIQLFRNFFSKKLSLSVGISSVSLCRFLYGAPIAYTFYLIFKMLYGPVEIISNDFFLWVFFFGASQLFANMLMVKLFNLRNFAVSISFIRTESIFVAILAIFFLGESLSIFEWLGVVIVFLGVLIMVLAKEKITVSALFKIFFNKAAFLGVFAGLLFAFAVIGVKKSFNYIEGSTLLLKSSFSLTVAMLMQVLLLVPIVLYFSRKDFLNIFKSPKLPVLIGLCSAIASIMWLTAFALTYVAYVKTIGQLEFILSILVSLFLLKETISRNEMIGIFFTLLGSIVLLLSS